MDQTSARLLEDSSGVSSDQQAILSSQVVELINGFIREQTQQNEKVDAMMNGFIREQTRQNEKVDAMINGFIREQTRQNEKVDTVMTTIDSISNQLSMIIELLTNDENKDRKLLKLNNTPWYGFPTDTLTKRQELKKTESLRETKRPRRTRHRGERHTVPSDAAEKAAYRTLQEECLSKSIQWMIVELLKTVPTSLGTIPQCINLSYLPKKCRREVEKTEDPQNKLRLFLNLLTNQPFNEMRNWLTDMQKDYPQIIDDVWNSFEEFKEVGMKGVMCWFCQAKEIVPIKPIADYLFSADIISSKLHHCICVSEVHTHQQNHLYEELAENCSKFRCSKVVNRALRLAIEAILDTEKKDERICSLHTKLLKEFTHGGEPPENMLSCRCRELLALQAQPVSLACSGLYLLHRQPPQSVDSSDVPVDSSLEDIVKETDDSKSLIQWKKQNTPKCIATSQKNVKTFDETHIRENLKTAKSTSGHYQARSFDSGQNENNRKQLHATHASAMGCSLSKTTMQIPKDNLQFVRTLQPPSASTSTSESEQMKTRTCNNSVHSKNEVFPKDVTNVHISTTKGQITVAKKVVNVVYGKSRLSTNGPENEEEGTETDGTRESSPNPSQDETSDNLIITNDGHEALNQPRLG